MAEYTIKASIHLEGLRWIKLSKPIQTELSNLEIKSLHLSSISDKELQVELKLEATSRTEARSLALVKLNSIADILSFKSDVANRVEIHTVEDEDGGEGLDVLQAFCSAADSKELDASVVEGYIKALAGYSCEVIDLLSRYREAIRQKDSILKYNFLYQLLDKAKKERKDLEEWFKKEEPHVQVVRDEKVTKISTMYTYLRDCIHHPKQNKFPLEEIEKYLPGLQRLARKAIMEKMEQQ